MRLALTLIVAGLLVSIAGYTQNNNYNISLNQRNDSLPIALRSIERQTGFKVKTSGDIWLRQFPHVSAKGKNLGIDKAVELVLKGLPFKYEILWAEHAIAITVDDMHGRVRDKDRMPLAGVTVTIPGTGIKVLTDTAGRYVIKNPLPGNILLFTRVNMKDQYRTVTANLRLEVELETKPDTLGEVVVSTGIQSPKKDRVGGSVEKLGKDIFGLPLSPDFGRNLAGHVSGLQFPPGRAGAGQLACTIRGISTFSANPNTLVVLDNFPYDGDMANINPNDIENVTVLKDAATASLWGIRAGNGVIVITTRKGRTGQHLKMELNTLISLNWKPDLYYRRGILDAQNFIGLEKFFYQQGYYDPALFDPSYPVLTPAVELLYKGSTHVLPDAAVNEQLSALEKNDMRAGLGKYAYRSAVGQEYALNVSGGDSKSATYFFMGFSQNPGNLVRNNYHRENISFRQSWRPMEKLLIAANAMLMQNIRMNNNDGALGLWYPYAQMADAQGNALSVPADRRASYIDTAGSGILEDWRLQPLNELGEADNKATSRDLYLSLNLRYEPLPHLGINVFLKYAEGGVHHENVYNRRTYYNRNLFNSYTQPSGLHVVPSGDIVDEARNEYVSNNVRLQIEYELALGHGHSITAMAGAEQPVLTTKAIAGRQYGVNGGQGSGRVDYQSYFPMYYNPAQLNMIDDRNFRAGTTRQLTSGYANITYSYHDRYIMSLNARKDEADFFGARTNYASAPLWSASVAWNLAKEQFLDSSKFKDFKIRLSAGYNGNYDTSVTALTSATPGGTNSYGLPTLTLVTMSNPVLKWERIRILNAGADFATKNNRFEGSVDLFIKEGLDLTADGRIDPTTGLTTLSRNTAGIISKGIDINLRTAARIGAVDWAANFIFSYINNRISHYPGSKLPAWQYVLPVLDRPLEGAARYGLVSFKSRGLDPQTGEPRGEWQGQPSNDYADIIGTYDRSTLVYSGPSTPTVFGSLRQTFTWKRLQLLVDISYKFNYFFRRTSIDYTAVLFGASLGHVDYKNRWQKPGDEKWTNIPSQPQQCDLLRDLFYTYSDALITRGDHIRWQDIQLSYGVNRQNHASLRVQEMRLYVSVQNLGILWKANKYGIDPDFPDTWPEPLAVAAGIKITF